MQDNLTQIAIVLDRSGSMGVVRDATIDSFNEFINHQKIDADAKPVNLLFVQFDSEGPHDVVFEGGVKYFQGLSQDTYVPRAMTPLHDAMGWTIAKLGDKLAATPEDQRPSKVIFVVLTDGLENASREFTRERVAEMVKQQTDAYKWVFLFLAANQDAVLSAKGFNIAAGSALSYNNTASGMRSGTGSASSVADLWKYSNASSFDPASMGFTDEDRKKAVEENK